MSKVTKVKGITGWIEFGYVADLISYRGQNKEVFVVYLI